MAAYTIPRATKNERQNQQENALLDLQTASYYHSLTPPTITTITTTTTTTTTTN